MKTRTVAAACVAVAAGLLAGCAPEPMTVSEACRAYDEMLLNTPQEDSSQATIEDNLVDTEYQIDYYRDWSQRVDGALGQAFADLAEAGQMELDKGDHILSEDPESEAYNALLWPAVREALRICR